LSVSYWLTSCSLCFFMNARFEAIEATSTPTVTMAIIIVDKALISGLTPSLTDE